VVEFLDEKAKSTGIQLISDAGFLEAMMYWLAVV